VQVVEGEETWGLSGDPEDVRRILLGKLTAAEKGGGYLTDKTTGERLTPEKIDIMVKERATVIGAPSVHMQFTFRGGDAVRFFCKIALAAGFKSSVRISDVQQWRTGCEKNWDGQMRISKFQASFGHSSLRQMFRSSTSSRCRIPM
jgi:hypothetical protein